MESIASTSRGPNATERIIGISPWAEQVRKSIELVAVHQSSVLILGPSGTGKELIAARVHFLSSRWEGVFLKMNCAAIRLPSRNT